jgi:hypothetical protein
MQPSTKARFPPESFEVPEDLYERLLYEVFLLRIVAHDVEHLPMHPVHVRIIQFVKGTWVPSSCAFNEFLVPHQLSFVNVGMGCHLLDESALIFCQKKQCKLIFLG